MSVGKLAQGADGLVIFRGQVAIGGRQQDEFEGLYLRQHRIVARVLATPDHEFSQWLGWDGLLRRSQRPAQKTALIKHLGHIDHSVEMQTAQTQTKSGFKLLGQASGMEIPFGQSRDKQFN